LPKYEKSIFNFIVFVLRILFYICGCRLKAILQMRFCDNIADDLLMTFSCHPAGLRGTMHISILKT